MGGPRTTEKGVMTDKTKRWSDAIGVRRIEHGVRGLAAELLLQHELGAIREEITALDDRCVFIEDVHGATSKVYRDAVDARDMQLLLADRLITRWVEKHDRTATAAA